VRRLLLLLLLLLLCVASWLVVHVTHVSTAVHHC
jgi:hypothetical protein